MAHIDYFFSTVSPYTYLAGTRLEEIATRHGASIAYKPVDILALFLRTGGQALKDRHDSRKEYRLQELRRQAAKAGMPINLAPAFFPVNSAPSSYAIIAAQAAVQAGGSGDLGAHDRGVRSVPSRTDSPRARRPHSCRRCGSTGRRDRCCAGR